MTVNGHIADERPEIPYAMPAQLMLGGEGGRLTDVSAAASAPFQVPRLGRGLAVGDLDDDGRLDAIVVGHDGPVAYFHNTGPGGRSIAIRLVGTASNRDAVGAACDGRGRRPAQVADRFGGGSYQSASDPRLHFGLGAATRVERGLQCAGHRAASTASAPWRPTRTTSSARATPHRTHRAHRKERPPPAHLGDESLFRKAVSGRASLPASRFSRAGAARQEPRPPILGTDAESETPGRCQTRYGVA